MKVFEKQTKQYETNVLIQCLCDRCGKECDVENEKFGHTHWMPLPAPPKEGDV